MIIESVIEVNEQNWLQATITFKDANGGQIIPTNARWQLWNVTGNAVAQPWTTITPAPQVVIAISALKLLITNPANEKEVYQFLVQGNEALADGLIAQAYITVNNVPNL